MYKVTEMAASYFKVEGEMIEHHFSQEMSIW